MFSKLNYIFLFCGLICISNNVFAQYKGGQASGGGDVKSLIVLPACTPPENTSIYFGGDANGAGISSLILLPFCTTPDNLNIYFGGEANGAGISSLILPPTCTTPENLSIFFGGSSNGDALVFFNQSSCPFPENVSIFYGGIANDAASANITYCPVATPVNIFFGGNADGYNLKKLQQQSCSITENTNNFFGGNADGIANISLIQLSCGVPENLNLFKGGNSDGYAKEVFIQFACLPAENTNVFLGGVADGYSIKSLTQVACPPVENYNISFGGNADGYAQILLAQSICALPENVQIFQGGNSNGEAIIILNQTICSYPENINIFLGGYSDGFFVNYLLQNVCSIPENINIFTGGSSDGYSIVNFQQGACPVSENISVSLGGFSDGYSIVKFQQGACSSPENVNIAFGGTGNGEAFGFFNQTSCPFIYDINICFGGVSNDAAYANITNCPVPIPANIYTGGNANGASIAAYTPLVCPTAQNTSIYFGGIANGAGISNLLRLPACSPPENINIYLGSYANGASTSKLVRLPACSPPENLDIYIGGYANGAGISKLVLLPACLPPDNLSISFGGNANGAAYSQKIILPACPPPINENIFFGGIADGYARRMLIQPYYWTGTVNNNWHNALNWTSEAVPDISSLAIIPSLGVVNFPIVSLALAESKTLVIQNGANLQIVNRNFTTDFDIVNDGTITITGNPLITIGGDYQGQNGVTTTGNAKFLFNAAIGTQTINFNTADVYEVEIATMPLASCQLAGNLTVRQNLTISSGIFNASTYNIVLDGNWNNAGNFTPGTGIVTFKGVNQTIINPLGEKYYNLTIQNNTQLVINNNIQVANILTLTSGKISTGANILTIGSGIPSPGSLNWISGRIIGRLERWISSSGTYLFPVGTSGNEETVSLIVNSGLTPGSVLTYFVSSNPGNGGLPVFESGISILNQFTEGYWNLTAANGLAINNFDISLKANGFTSYTINFETRILKRTNGGAWTLDGTHVDASDPNCYRNGLTGGISALGTQFAIGVGDCIGGQIGADQFICSGSVPAPFTSIVDAKIGSTYTWQYTTNAAAIPGDVNWTNIALSDTPWLNYSTPLTQNTWFIRKTSCGPKYSNVIGITVYPIPVTGTLYHIPNNFGN